MPTSNGILVASAGDLSLMSGVPVPFTIFWQGLISESRWSRAWPAIISPGDEDINQTVTVLSEGAEYVTETNQTVNTMTLQGGGFSGAPVRVQVLVMACTGDVF